MSRCDWLSKDFQQKFDATPEVVCHAPGRVNLIGEHTDYNEGFVLPAAINYGTDIVARKRADRKVRIFAKDFDEQSEFFLDNIQFDNEKMWTNYAAGSIKMLLEAYPEISGADIAVSGNVPQGAGLSSSASFEVAILKTFTILFDLDLDGVKAALLGQKAENEFVGCNCGIMDQLISSMGQQGHAMLLDCRSLTFEDAPIPTGYTIFIVNSNVRRGLVDSEYNDRREQCEWVARHFAKKALRDVTATMLLEDKAAIDPVLFKRAMHVVTENVRTEATLRAMRKDDIKTLSRLMKESHISMRDDFEITTPEIDGLVSIIDKEIGDQGGVRMTGGGFGGCVVALVPDAMVDSLIKVVEAKYTEQFKLVPRVYICTASQGAFRPEVS